MDNYDEVPSIITGKDLDYLSDMFNWNYIALKNTNDMKNNANDPEIKDMLENGFDLFKDNMNTIMDILGGNNDEDM